MAFLQGPSPKQFEMIKQELGENSDDMERGVRDLRSMLAASPHLPSPEALDTRLLELFVRGCRLNKEQARSKLEAFCMARARYGDLYGNCSISKPPLSDVFNSFIDIVPLPRLTDEGLRVTVFRIKPNYPESAADIAAVVKAILLVSDVRMRDEKPMAGDVFVYEVSQLRSSIVARVAAAVNSVRRGIHLAHNAYPQRLKRIHIVGGPPFIASTLQLVRSCLNDKIKKRMLLHNKIEELLDHIPSRVLPVEFGGNEDSIDSLAKKWRCRVDEVRDYLQDLNEACHSAPLPKSDYDIYGAVGAFRKLDID